MWDLSRHTWTIWFCNHYCDYYRSLLQLVHISSFSGIFQCFPGYSHIPQCSGEYKGFMHYYLCKSVIYGNKGIFLLFPNIPNIVVITVILGNSPNIPIFPNNTVYFGNIPNITDIYGIHINCEHSSLNTEYREYRGNNVYFPISPWIYGNNGKIPEYTVYFGKYREIEVFIVLFGLIYPNISQYYGNICR